MAVETGVLRNVKYKVGLNLVNPRTGEKYFSAVEHIIKPDPNPTKSEKSFIRVEKGVITHDELLKHGCTEEYINELITERKILHKLKQRQ